MTKRLYEVAKEYGVSTTIVRKTLEDHQIKAGNFISIDDKMKGILDAAFKKGPKGDAKADRKPERKPESRPERKTEKKQEHKTTGEGNSRTVNETSRQNKNRKQSNPRRQNSQNRTPDPR